ncbi:MAG: hypothetical protein CMJ34_01900 [Phycisphaerae bacterium]|nr:hypothetical protein [Phycisphaerae bacterium]
MECTGRPRKIAGKKRDVLSECETIRTVLGTMISLAQKSDSEKWEYLVPGGDIRPEDWTPKDLDSLEKRVDDQLKLLTEVLKESLQISSTGDAPTNLLAVMGLLFQLDLPDQEQSYHLTDEGLVISDWGTEEGVPLFPMSSPNAGERTAHRLARVRERIKDQFDSYRERAKKGGKGKPAVRSEERRSSGRPMREALQRVSSLNSQSGPRDPSRDSSGKSVSSMQSGAVGRPSIMPHASPTGEHGSRSRSSRPAWWQIAIAVLLGLMVGFGTFVVLHVAFLGRDDPDAGISVDPDSTSTATDPGKSSVDEMDGDQP